MFFKIYFNLFKKIYFKNLFCNIIKNKSYVKFNYFRLYQYNKQL